jgi:hypothetical protein
MDRWMDGFLHGWMDVGLPSLAFSVMPPVHLSQNWPDGSNGSSCNHLYTVQSLLYLSFSTNYSVSFTDAV